MLEQQAMTPKHYYVELKFDVHHEVADRTPVDLESIVDMLMDALEDVEGLTDVDLEANLEDSTIVFCVSLTAVSQPEAHRLAVLGIRTAVHASGGRTPGWEKEFESLFEREQYQGTVYSAEPAPV